jgi:nucleolar protein TMA23
VLLSMDAQAFLTAQGWRGSGHSLHATSDSKGLARPLLVAKKQDTLGLGQGPHRTSDMWWMDALDKSLKGLDTSQPGRVVQTVADGTLDVVARGRSRTGPAGGLYASFVQGESLGSTIAPEASTAPNKSRKRSAGKSETREERRARKAARRAARASHTPDLGSRRAVPANRTDNEMVSSAKIEMETKEQRWTRRKQKIVYLEQTISMKESPLSDRQEEKTDSR